MLRLGPKTGLILEEHRTEVGLARLRQLKKDRNRQQPISIAMRLEG
jgi:hypothetical protein